MSLQQYFHNFAVLLKFGESDNNLTYNNAPVTVGGSGGITGIWRGTQSQYDALSAQDRLDLANSDPFYVFWIYPDVVAVLANGSFILPSLSLRPVVSPIGFLAQTLDAVSGVFALPAVSLRPVISIISLQSVSNGIFALPSVFLQPSVQAVGIVMTPSGVSNGNFTLPAVSLRSIVSTVAMQSMSNGAFALSPILLRPVISAVVLQSTSNGIFSLPAVSLRPVISAVAMQSVQNGSFTVPSVSLRPAISAISFVAASDTTAPTVTAFTVGAVTGNTVASCSISANDTGTGGSNITYWAIVESATNTRPSDPTSWTAVGTPASSVTISAGTFTSAGTVTRYLHAFVKDSASNIGWHLCTTGDGSVAFWGAVLGFYSGVSDTNSLGNCTVELEGPDYYDSYASYEILSTGGRTGTYALALTSIDGYSDGEDSPAVYSACLNIPISNGKTQLSFYHHGSNPTLHRSDPFAVVSISVSGPVGGWYQCTAAIPSGATSIRVIASPGTLYIDDIVVS
jgi:hypothetical protein